MQLILDSEAPSAHLNEKMSALDQKTLSLTEKPITNGDFKEDNNIKLDVKNADDSDHFVVSHSNETSDKTDKREEITPRNETIKEKADLNTDLEVSTPSAEIIEESSSAALKETVSTTKKIEETLVSGQDSNEKVPLCDDLKTEELKKYVTVTEEIKFIPPSELTEAFGSQTKDFSAAMQKSSVIEEIKETVPITEDNTTVSSTEVTEEPVSQTAVVSSADQELGAVEEMEGPVTITEESMTFSSIEVTEEPVSQTEDVSSADQESAAIEEMDVAITIAGENKTISPTEVTEQSVSLTKDVGSVDQKSGVTEAIEEAVTNTKEIQTVSPPEDVSSADQEASAAVDEVKETFSVGKESVPVVEEMEESISTFEKSVSAVSKIKEACVEPKETDTYSEKLKGAVLHNEKVKEPVPAYTDLMETDQDFEKLKGDVCKETDKNIPSQELLEKEEFVSETNMKNSVKSDEESKVSQMEIDEEHNVGTSHEELIKEPTEKAMKVDDKDENAFLTPDVDDTLETEVNDSLSELVNNITKDLDGEFNTESLDELNLESDIITKEKNSVKDAPVINLNEIKAIECKDINQSAPESEIELPKAKDEMKDITTIDSKTVSNGIILETANSEDSSDRTDGKKEPEIKNPESIEVIEGSEKTATTSIECNDIKTKTATKENDSTIVEQEVRDEEVDKLDVSMETDSDIIKITDRTDSEQDGDVVTIQSSESEKVSLDVFDITENKSEVVVVNDQKINTSVKSVDSIIDLDDEKIVEDMKSDSEPQVKKPKLAEKVTPFIRLSNTMDILSDDEDEPPKEKTENVALAIQEKQCINLDDDDDIMLIDEDTSIKDKKEEYTSEKNENIPVSEAKTDDRIVDLDPEEKNETVNIPDSEEKIDDRIVDLDPEEKCESEPKNNDKIVDLDSEEKVDSEPKDDDKIVDLDMQEKAETKPNCELKVVDLETFKCNDKITKSPEISDLDKETSHFKKQDKSGNGPVKEATEAPQKVEQPKPLIPEDFFKTYRKNLTDMTRDDLEEFCILKIVESIIDRSNLNEIRAKLKTMAQNIDEYKKKALMLTKQNRDLQVVLKSVQEEQKKKTNQPIAPLKITRSVGMQVLMTDRNRKRNMPIPTPPTPSSNVNQAPSTTTTRVTRTSSLSSKGSKAVAPQQIPVPRLVPAVNNSQNKTNAAPQVVASNNVSKNVVSLNGVKVPLNPPKASEKRTHSRMQAQHSPSPSLPSPSSSSVTVDLTDDEPPSKVPAKASPTPPVRLLYQQNLASPRQPFPQASGSPRKVFIPINGQGQVRGNQTIMLKTVGPSNGPRPKGNTATGQPMVRMPSNAMSAIRRVQGNSRHPAPLPEIMKQYQPPNWKALPPAPDLKLSKVENGIVISWKIDGYQEDSYEEIASYQLYAYQETSAPPSTTLWKKIGDVKALPLPMACTLTQFMAGYKYYFAVRAVDIRSRLGPFSLPGSILLLNKM